jgi:hypothetical protein
MVRAGYAEFFENRISLRVFLGKRVGADAVMLEKLLRFHAVNPGSSLVGSNGDCEPGGRATTGLHRECCNDLPARACHVAAIRGYLCSKPSIMA